MQSRLATWGYGQVYCTAYIHTELLQTRNVYYTRGEIGWMPPTRIDVTRVELVLQNTL